MIVFLDSGVLGKLCNPNKKGEAAECENWLFSLLARSVYVVTSDICDYEVRRSLILESQRKPNINSIASLIDFGAVKESVSETIPLSQPSADRVVFSETIGIGTEGYIPSEQAIGKPKLCSDVYAVGIIAIQALTGLTPK